MNGVGYKLNGVAGLREQLAAVDAQLAAKALASSMRAVFKPVLDTARALVPVDTGELRDSLVLSVVKPSGGDLVVAVGIRIGKGTGAKQAKIAAAAFGEGQLKTLSPSRRWHFIELGTVHMKARPFLRPALDKNAQRVLSLLKDEVARRIQKALAKQKG